MNLSAKQEFWKKHDQSYEARGLTIVQYCKKNGINRHTFQYYRQKFRRGQFSPATATAVDVPSRFVRVLPAPRPPSVKTNEIVGRLRIGSGVALECLSWPDPHWLVRLSREVLRD